LGARNPLSDNPAMLFTLRLLPSGAVAQVRPGDRVLDALDEQLEPGPWGADLPTACRSANCGVCQVVVRQGAQRLEPALRREIALLAELGGPKGGRLGCQLVIAGAPTSVAPAAPSPGEIVLEVIPRARAQT
jgi:ferredoxin